MGWFGKSHKGNNDKKTPWGRMMNKEQKNLKAIKKRTKGKNWDN
jgi:hypothetical protein